jgi:hypothetical protein
MPTLTVKQDTWAKATTDPSGELPGDQKALLTAGEYEILAYGEASTDDRYSGQDHAAVHMVVTFDPDDLPVAVHDDEGTRLNTVVLYHGHAEVEGAGPGYAAGGKNNPVEAAPSPKPPAGRIVAIAGLGPRGMKDPIDGCRHFTWGEATRNGTRLPDTVQQSKNIVDLGKYLDQIRAKLGDRPIRITSWLRPVAVNRAVGGAKNSTHIQGFAADIAVQGMSPRQVFNALDSWHGARGGLAHGVGFTHVDLRKPPYRARWRYPGV